MLDAFKRHLRLEIKASINCTQTLWTNLEEWGNVTTAMLDFVVNKPKTT
jgi:putative heme iron utilization protein